MVALGRSSNGGRMCKYNIKDLLQVADDDKIFHLYAAYSNVRPSSIKTLKDNFVRFWAEIDHMEPCATNTLALGIRHNDGVDAVFYDKRALLQIYTDNNPLLQFDNCSALSFDDVLCICRTEAFYLS